MYIIVSYVYTCTATASINWCEHGDKLSGIYTAQWKLLNVIVSSSLESNYYKKEKSKVWRIMTAESPAEKFLAN